MTTVYGTIVNQHQAYEKLIKIILILILMNIKCYIFVDSCQSHKLEIKNVCSDRTFVL